jgi:hypothetical protein
MTNEHNFIKYLFSYMFRPYGCPYQAGFWNILKEVYISHCARKISLLTNMFFNSINCKYDDPVKSKHVVV